MRFLREFKKQSASSSYYREINRLNKTLTIGNKKGAFKDDICLPEAFKILFFDAPIAPMICHYGCCCSRKKAAFEVLGNITPVIGIPLVTVTQFVEDALVVVCKT